METTPLPQCWTDLESALQAGIDRIILFGPPGTGKTYAGMTMGDTTAGAWRLVCTEDMTSAQLEGMWKPARDSWSWVDGEAVLAWQGNGLRGGRLVVDEIDKASGDVLGLFLAMTDSPESASWKHPETNKVYRPKDGFSVVMTTNVEQMRDLPEALVDRFPIAIRINEPHPAALERLSSDLRRYATRMADAGERRISLRAFYTFDQMRKKIGEDQAARIVFRDRAQGVLDAIAIDKVGV